MGFFRRRSRATPASSRPVVEELEPRVMLSADIPAPLVAPIAGIETASIHEQLVPAETAGITAGFDARRELVVVDAGVSDLEALLEDLRSERPDRVLEVVVLDPDRDGIEQLSEILSDYSGELDAVHVISHGSDAALRLGSGRLEASDLEVESDRFAAWGDAFAEGGDLLLYGCDLAASEEGRALVEGLAAATGADVAASVDLTGATRLGGDWDLEYATGRIESSLALGAGARSAWGGVLNSPPAGGEIAVNTTTAGAQTDAAVASDATGNFVIVWESGGNILGQRFAGDGSTLGGEFVANTTTAGTQSNPHVARNDAGAFVVVWESDGGDIFAQRFDAMGVAQGGEIAVNTTTADAQRNSRVAIDDSGAFVVVWESANQDGSGTGIYGQRFDAAGVAQGGEFLVNSTTLNNQSVPDVSKSGAGSFVVVWEHNNGANTEIRGQRYDAAGVAQGGEFLAHAPVAVNQRAPVVTMNDDASFVIAWENANDIYARVFDATGTPLAAEFQVNSTLVNSASAQVATDASGNFVVVWEHSGTGADPGKGVLAQEFDAFGNPIGSEFGVNATTGGDQRFPAVTRSDGGSYVVVWHGAGPGDPDGIFGQMYGADAASFQNDGSYTATLDTEIREGSPTSSFALNPTISIDTDNGSGETQGLLRFDDIFGSGPGQIPLGSTIHSVTLTLEALDGSVGTIRLHRMLAAWDGSATWDTFAGGGTGIQTDGSEALAAEDASIPSPASTGAKVMSSAALAASVQAWSDGASNYGWVLVSDSPDQWDLASSENATQAFRPKLQIVYSPPPNGAPVLTPAGPTFTAITEDDTANGGDTVASLLGVSVTDPDAGALEGMAVTGLSSGNGTWEYSTDGGTVWNAVGAVAGNNALLLRDVDLLRFVPDGQNGESPDPSVSYRAWDQTSGAFGTKVDASTTGGTSAFSTATDTATIAVGSVNDAPVLTPASPTFTAITEDDTANGGNTIASLLGASVSDVDAGALEGIALTGLAPGNGSWEFSIDGGASWSAVGAVAGNDALLLRDSDLLRFVPDGENGESPDPTVSYRAWDRTAGSEGTRLDPGAGGGASTFSSSSDSASVSVAAINDAPVLTLPPPQAIAFGEPLVFSSAGGNAIRVGDVDAGGAPLELTLDAVGGRVSLSTTAGLSFLVGDGSADPMVTFRGTLAAMNGALEGARFDLDPALPGTPSLQVLASDLGSTGAGGPATQSGAIAIQPSAVPPPVEAAPPADQREEDVEMPLIDASTPLQEQVVELAASTRSTAMPASTQPPVLAAAAGRDFRDPDPGDSALGGDTLNEPGSKARELVRNADRPEPEVPEPGPLVDPLQWQAFEQIRDEVRLDAEREQRQKSLVAASAEGLAIVASAGVIAGLLRAGSLVALTVSSLPMWRLVDPMPVLGLSEEERERYEADLEAEDEVERRLARMFDTSSDATPPEPHDAQAPGERTHPPERDEQ